MNQEGSNAPLFPFRSSFVTALLFIAILCAAILAPRSFTEAASHDPEEVEEAVREYFEDIPVMVEIARCESKFRQFTDSGNPFYGGYGGGMVGIFQIYESVHDNAARDLGFDIETVDGNIGYAHHLYKQS